MYILKGIMTSRFTPTKSYRFNTLITSRDGSNQYSD